MNVFRIKQKSTETNSQVNESIPEPLQSKGKVPPFAVRSWLETLCFPCENLLSLNPLSLLYNNIPYTSKYIILFFMFHFQSRKVFGKKNWKKEKDWIWWINKRVFVSTMQLSVQLWSSEWCLRWGYLRFQLTPLWALPLGGCSARFVTQLWAGIHHHCHHHRHHHCRLNDHPDEWQSLKEGEQHTKNLHHSSPRSTIAPQPANTPSPSMRYRSMSLAKTACCSRCHY